MAIAGVGVAGVVTIAVAGVAWVVVARSQKGVAIIPVATEEVLALQEDDIQMNIRDIIVTCNPILRLFSGLTLTLLASASASASASGAGAARAMARRAEAMTMKNFILIRVVVVVAGCR